MWAISLPWIVFTMLGAFVSANDILKTAGFTKCQDDSAIDVQRLNISLDRESNRIAFDVAGRSSRSQKIMASLAITAYGKNVFSKEFNPCDEATKVEPLCPIPSGDFAAKGTQDVPAEYAGKVPTIAFNIPNLEGQAKLELKSIDDGKSLACIESEVTNGKSMIVPAMSYVAAGIAMCALLLSGFSALATAGAAGCQAPTPGFGTVVTWFQSVAMNGMMSVPYPPVYQEYTKNFAFAGGLISWRRMQSPIDSFRKATGGNLTENNVSYLENVSIVHTTKQHTQYTRRGLHFLFSGYEPVLATRDTAIAANGLQAGNGTAKTANGTESNAKVTHTVHGIQSYVEQLTIPQANTFLTVLMAFAIVVASITVSILLFKVILESWALFASFPKRLSGFRKRYWGLLGRTITNLVLLLYGVWTLYCIFQFTNGDSWVAKLLAGVTLGVFTVLLGFFTFKIWQLAQRFKKMDGDTSALFEDKETWRKYSLFYDNYKRGYWWLFMPAIVYMFAKGCVIAGGNGHGLMQTAGQLIVESLMLILLLWCRPFVSSSGNWIHKIIQVVRTISVVCILVFVEELGISQSTKTITGVILVAVQSALTGLLAILIAVNAIIVCVRENPHRKQRKEAEKLNRDLDDLTALSPRNSMLMSINGPKDRNIATNEVSSPWSSLNSFRPYSEHLPPIPGPKTPVVVEESSESLAGNALPVKSAHNLHQQTRSSFNGQMSRQPTIPAWVV